VHRFWRNGVVISRGTNWALVEVLPLRRCISISVRTDDNYAPLLMLVNDIIKQLMDNWFSKVIAKQFVPCSHCIENQSYDPWLFSVDECEEGLLKEQYYVTCQRRKNHFSNIQIERLIPDLSLKEYERYKINLEDIQMDNKHLAEGAYGLLYRGTWNDQEVAVKILRSDEIIEEKIAVFKEFRREVSIMSELKHENLVELKGFSVSGGKAAMIMEFMKHGDLYSIIKTNELPPPRLPLSTAIKFGVDIAKGMEFLHSLTPPILHRDLKPPNILITKSEDDEFYTAKVADFGLSARQYLLNLKERAVETPIWVAPEILKKEPYTTKSDVYSYATILYEIFERKLPFENVQFRFLNELEEQIIRGSRSDISQLSQDYPEIASLIRDCWDGEPFRRPTFSNIINRWIDIIDKYDPNLNSILGLNKRDSIAPNLEEERLQNPKINVEGKWMKRLQLDNPDCVLVLTLVGSEIWSAHKNGDIGIWSAENGKLLRQIFAAHSREIRSMVLVGTHVWTGCRDGLIKLWRARSLCNELIQDNILILKEGFIDNSGLFFLNYYYYFYYYYL
jgi:serine/threonine protein kinase